MTAATDLVLETTTGTGTGNLTVARYGGLRRFSGAFGTGATPDVFYYNIWNEAASDDEWEFGTGHMSDANTLVRDTVIASSNSNNAVNFGAGRKFVANSIIAAQIVREGSSPQFSSIELGHASDTTLTRAAPGLVSVEGVPLARVFGTPTADNIASFRSADQIEDSSIGITDLVLEGDLAGQAAAEAGTNNTFWMSPLRTAQAIAALGNSYQWVRQVFTSSGTYTPTAGMVYAIIRVQAAGGGAGGADGAGTADWGVYSGAGGGGEYAEGVFTAATIGASQTVTIGAVGGGGTNTGGNGGTGNGSQVGSLITALGGGPGIGSGSNSTSSTTIRASGSGGTGGSGGSFRVPGGRGGTPSWAQHGAGTSTSFVTTLTQGGWSFMGGITQPKAYDIFASLQLSGNTGNNYGSGGSGAWSGSTTGSQGGAGGPGIIIIDELVEV